MLGKNGGKHVVFQAEEHRKQPEYFGEVPFFSLVTSEKVKKAKTCLQKPLWAKSLRILEKKRRSPLYFSRRKALETPRIP